MSEIKIKKLFINLSIVSAVAALILILISNLNNGSIHSANLIFHDIIPIASLVLFAVFLFIFKEIKKELAVIPLIIGQASLAFSHTFYYTKLNVGPWTWHVAFNTNNIIEIIPHVLLIIFFFLVLFNVFKSKLALIISAVVAFAPEIMRMIVNYMNNVIGITDRQFDLITLIQFFTLLAVVLAYMPVKLYLKNEESLEKYDLNSIANNLSKYTGKENNDPFGTSKAQNEVNGEVKAEPEELNEEIKVEEPEVEQIEATEPLEENIEEATLADAKPEKQPEQTEQIKEEKPKFKQVVPFGADLLNEFKNTKKKEEKHETQEELMPKEEETTQIEEEQPVQEEIKAQSKEELAKEQIPNETNATQGQNQAAPESQNEPMAEPNGQYAANPYANYNPYVAPPYPPYYMPAPYPQQEQLNQQMQENNEQQANQNQPYNPYYQQPMPPYPPYYYPQPQQPEDPNQQQYAYPPQGAPIPYYPYPPYQAPNQPNKPNDEDNSNEKNE